MSIVGVTNVVVQRNPAALSDPFELEVSFECLEDLQEDLEWKLVYVGDPEDKTKDQELDCIALGPIQRGTLRFVFVADAPDFSLISKEDINGITVILLTGSYRHQEFVRVGWYVHNVFSDPYYIEHPPDVDELSLDEMLAKMQRIILADAPRVTRFCIEWDRPNVELSLPFGCQNVTHDPQMETLLQPDTSSPDNNFEVLKHSTEPANVAPTPQSNSSYFSHTNARTLSCNSTTDDMCSTASLFYGIQDAKRVSNGEFPEDTNMSTM